MDDPPPVIPSPDEWPHRDVGIPWPPLGEPPPTDPAEHYMLAGAIHDGKRIRQGRLYTEKEWEMVKAEVQPFAKALCDAAMAGWDYQSPAKPD
jgi:hypothetical protein